jgi:hypothetical protein
MRRSALRGVVWLVAMAATALGPAAARAGGPVPPIKHVFVIVLENKGFDETFGYRSPSPYLAWTLPSMGALVPNYYAVTHQSLANYVAMVSGQGANPSTQSDCLLYVDVVPGTVGPDGQAMGNGCVYPAGVQTIANQLAGRGLTWKGYMEDMGNGAGQPQTCRHPAIGSPDSTQTARKGDQYAARHNPFVYFHSIIDTSACGQDDVPLDRLPGDLRYAARTPSYSFIVPNLCDDGHDSPCVDGRPGGLVTSDSFLRTWVPRILASRAYRSGGLLAIIFDESESSDSSACCQEPQFPNTPNNGGETPGPGGGRTGAVLLSPYIDPGTIDVVPHNHFTLLRSFEDLFGLSHLGYAAQPGLQPLGTDLFTCYRASPPRPHRGRLPLGSEIKLAVIGQGTFPRPMLELKLWHPGPVSVAVVSAHSRSGSRRSRSRRLRTIARARGLAPCQLLKVRVPSQHGTAIVTASALGGSERRTLSF